MSDILNITDAQARVLRAISYYESESGEKGATQYACSKKVPNRLPTSGSTRSKKRPDKLHVSGSTFNDNINVLAKNLMVFRLDIKKNGKKETKPYTITDIGQIAWLRYFPLSENIEIVQKIFPNIQLSAIDDIINQIQNPLVEKIKNKFSLGILRIALNSFHIENISFPPKDYWNESIKETIELGHYNIVNTSFSRYYSVILPKFLEESKMNYPSLKKTPNFNELKISILDRIILLFYYNLIQSVKDPKYTAIFVIDLCFPKLLSEEETSPGIGISSKELIQLSVDMKDFLVMLTKNKKKILKIITSDDQISKIMIDNLKNVKEYKSKDNDFQNISQIFFKK